jgi:hypothetical protein
MRLQLPESFKDVTVGQIMQHGSRELDDVQCLNVYGGYSVMEVLDMPIVLVEEGAKHMREILANPEQLFNNIIEIDGKRYGFVTDWSEFKTKEYLDVIEYQKDTTANASKIMAVLYRPITREMGKHYEVEPYNGTRHHEVFKNASAANYYGLLVFFSAILNSSTTTSRRSLLGRAKATASQTSGDGIIALWTWLAKTLPRSTRSLSTRSPKS